MSSAADLVSVTPDPGELRRGAAIHLAVGAGCLAAAAAFIGQEPDQRLRVGLVALALFLPLAAIVLARIAAHHPYPRFGAANATTTARAVLTCLFAGMLFRGGAGADPALGQGLGVLAGLCLLLDGLDGWLARRLGLCSDFGARYDMEVDAVLIMLLALAAWSLGKAGPWVLASGLLRYGFVAAGWALPLLRTPLPPSLRRKAVCVVQTGALCLLAPPWIHPPASGWIAGLALTLLAGSFALDLAWLLGLKRLRTGSPP